MNTTRKEANDRNTDRDFGGSRCRTTHHNYSGLNNLQGNEGGDLTAQQNESGSSNPAVAVGLVGWHAAAFCDGAPIVPHLVSDCAGGCGMQVDSKDGLCRRCRQLLQEAHNAA